MPLFTIFRLQSTKEGGAEAFVVGRYTHWSSRLPEKNLRTTSVTQACHSGDNLIESTHVFLFRYRMFCGYSFLTPRIFALTQCERAFARAMVKGCRPPPRACASPTVAGPSTIALAKRKKESKQARRDKRDRAILAGDAGQVRRHELLAQNWLQAVLLSRCNRRQRPRFCAGSQGTDFFGPSQETTHWRSGRGKMWSERRTCTQVAPTMPKKAAA